MTARTPGLEIAFHNALADPITIAGVPRTVAILNGVLGAIIVLGLQVPWLGLPLALLIHAAAYALTKRDPYFFPVLGRHLRQRPHWDA